MPGGGRALLADALCDPQREVSGVENSEKTPAARDVLLPLPVHRSQFPPLPCWFMPGEQITRSQSPGPVKRRGPGSLGWAQMAMLERRKLLFVVPACWVSADFNHLGHFYAF
jgi:hypothetical protein